jgi:hypothetical protein
VFRSISSSLDRKKNKLEEKKSATAVADEVVSEFIQDIFGGPRPAIYFKTEYDSVSCLLTITTKSKTLASELLLRSGEMKSVLKQKRVSVKLITVR